MELDCCGGHLCTECYEKVKKQFQDCPLCRQANFSSKSSRFMLTVLSQYKLFCPAEECNESIPYEYFARHTNTCLALNKKSCPHCKKLYWKNDFQHHLSCIEELNKKNQANQKKVKDLQSKNKSLTRSRNDLSQNNKELKARNNEHEHTIGWLKEQRAKDSVEIQNLRNTIFAQNDKISVAASDRNNFQNERKKVNNLEWKLYSETRKLKLTMGENDDLKSINSALERSLRNISVEYDRMKNSKFYRNLFFFSLCFLLMFLFRCSSLRNELDTANDIISNLQAKLGLKPKVNIIFIFMPK